jgi:acyl-coenzyme A thioesterase PaaI-like protein
MCFGCGRDNPIGLKLCFEWDGKTARAEFTPGEYHQGWSGFLHGGIITCVLDEALTYAAYFTGVDCITAEINVRIKLSAPVNQPMVVASSVVKKTRKLIETKASLCLKDGTVVAEGTSTQFVVKNRESEANNVHQ